MRGPRFFASPFHCWCFSPPSFRRWPSPRRLESPGLSNELLSQALDAPAPEFGQLTNSEAAEELPHQDLGREEAVELTEAVFDPILEDAVGPVHGFEVERYLGDNAAIVPNANSEAPVEVNGGGDAESQGASLGEPVLLESTLPLRTEDENGHKEPVDLSLEASGNVLEPKAPLVEVELPQEIGSGIGLPGVGIEVELPEAPSERAPSVINDTVATYPNIATDTDFSAVPTPAGVETLTTLRSADAPREQTFQLRLPAGATLRQVGEGAEVEQDGRTILRVPAPSAIDATGASVPVDLEVDGNSFVLTAHPDASTQFPALIDPLFEAYDWYYFKEQTGQDTWYSNRTANATGMELSKDPYGLFIRARHEFAYSNGSQADWTYYVPRFKEEQAQGRVPSSFVQKLTLWHMAFVTQPGGTFAPYMFAGIWGDKGWAGKPGGYAVWSYAGNAPTFYMNAPGNGMLVEFENGEPAKRDETAKAGVFGLASTEYVPPTTQSRLAAVGAAAVEVGDVLRPSTSNGSVATSWVNQTATAPLSATAEDSGLGVKKIGFDLPYKGPKWVLNSCVGTVSSPCPLNWTAKLMSSFYNPSEMPQGIIRIPIDAEDVLGNRALRDTQAVLWVDHSAPSLELSGSLTEQAKVGTGAAQYALKYSAMDGESDAAAALSPVGTAGIGEGKTQRPFGVALDGSGNAYMVDRECKCVQKYDSTGKFLSQFGTPGSGNGQFSDPRGISYSRTTGNILVSDLANKNVQIFTPSGAFVRKVAYGSFVEPYAVAHTGGNSFWVTDIGSDKVFAFRESDGAYLGQAYGSPADPNGSATGLLSPVGVAADPATGRMFVSDNGLNRVTVFSIATGKYSHHFGSEGTGNGQFKGPIGVAVAPSGHVLVADDLNNRIQVFQPTGSYVRQFGASGSGDGQLKEPRGIAIGAGNRLYIADAGNKRIARWDHAVYDPQSGVVKVQVKVDGQVVATPFNQACPEENCTSSKEWVYKSSDYATGQHQIDVVSTDGVGLPTTKSVTVSSNKDTTAPQLTANSSFFTAPEGWVEQKSYAYTATAKDPGGYGVTSMILKIDGQTVQSVTQSCLNGGCERALIGSINMANYKGGAHPAELIVTDGAGLVTKKAWTVNVSPKGVVSPGESEDTMEALEATDEESEIVTPTDDVISLEERVDGNDPGLEVDGESVKSVGVPVSIDFTTDPGDGVSIPTPDGEVHIEPTSAITTGQTAIMNGVASVTSNTAASHDTVIRPTYNGLTDFQVIRGADAPETFEWNVTLQAGQKLESVDSKTAQVVYKDGLSVMMIRAESARDATGKAVPTSLQVISPNAVRLTVSHKVGGFSYPVSAGPAFEVGYSTVRVELPPELLPPSNFEEEGWMSYLVVSAPEPINNTDTEAMASGIKPVKKSFAWIMCSHRGSYYEEVVTIISWEEECGNPFTKKPGRGTAYRSGLHGTYLIKNAGTASEVWHEGTPTDRIGCITDEHNEPWPAGRDRESWVERCVWWGPTAYGGGPKAKWGKHITAVGHFAGKSRGGCGDNCNGTPNPWQYFDFPPMAIYIWASGHVGRHETNCIDCE